MSEKIYLIFIIHCGILLEGISGSLFEDNNHNNSSNLHFRTKRMIGQAFIRNNERVTQNPIYIAKVLKNNEKICAGVIVSPRYILTPEKCVSEQEARYTVETGAPHSVDIHTVEDILDERELALLLIKPPVNIESSSLNRRVQLTEVALPARMSTSIFVWDLIGEVRAISPVPIADLLECGRQYFALGYPIIEDNICTRQLHGRYHCSNADIGSPLVVNDILLGVLFRAGRVLGPHVPDVFIRVNGNEYYNWANKYIQPYLRNNRHN